MSGGCRINVPDCPRWTSMRSPNKTDILGNIWCVLRTSILSWGEDSVEKLLFAVCD